jgi:hypothetical protein
VGVHDQACDLVRLVRHDSFIQERHERQIRQRELRCDTLLAALRRQLGELITAAERGGLGEQGLEVAEAVSARANRRCVHGVLLSSRGNYNAKRVPRSDTALEACALCGFKRRREKEIRDDAGPQSETHWG